MNIAVEMNETEIRKILSSYVEDKYGITIAPTALNIEVKSKHNYNREWENADIRLKIQVGK